MDSEANAAGHSASEAAAALGVSVRTVFMLADRGVLRTQDGRVTAESLEALLRPGALAAALAAVSREAEARIGGLIARLHSGLHGGALENTENS